MLCHCHKGISLSQCHFIHIHPIPAVGEKVYVHADLSAEGGALAGDTGHRLHKEVYTWKNLSVFIIKFIGFLTRLPCSR